MINKDDIGITYVDWKDKSKKILNVKYNIKGVQDNIDISINQETKKITVLSDGLIVGLPKESSLVIMRMIIDKIRNTKLINL